MELRRITREVTYQTFLEERGVRLNDEQLSAHTNSFLNGPVGFMYSAHVDESDEYVGTVTSADYGEEGIEVGIEIREHLRNHGYGTQAMRLFAEYLRSQNDKKIWLSVDTQNEAAIHVYEKIGFVRQKTQTYIAKDGSQRLQHIMVFKKTE